MKPRKSILSKDFVYRNAASTDVTKTWARAKREMKCSTTAAIVGPKPIPMKKLINGS